MSGFTIGRLSSSVLDRAAAMNVTARTISLSGRIQAPAGTDAFYAARDQLMGLGSNLDEEIVPFVCGWDPTLTQVVRVTDAQVEYSQEGNDALGYLPYSIELERLPNGALPSIESTLLGGFRANDVAIAPAACIPWHGVPSAVEDYNTADIIYTATTTRASASGNVDIYTYPPGISRQLARYALRPDDWYVGAAKLEVKYGSTWFPVHGRSLPPGIASGRWRFGNDIVRCYPSATAGRLCVEYYTGTAWSSPRTVILDSYNGTNVYTVNRFPTINATRIAPEESTISLAVGTSFGGTDYPHRTTMDITVRRGARMLEFHWSTAGAVILGRVTMSPNEAGTGITGGGSTTATPVFVAFSPENATYSNVNASLNANPVRATSFNFGLGFSVGTSTAEAPADLRDQYFAPYGERMTVVGW